MHYISGSKMKNTVQSIVILGGGSAGWLTASLLAAEHPQLSITLIESPDIPTIGVGEGTWPSMRNTLKRIGIKEIDFLKACDASFKQGSKFINWCSGNNEHYFHPFMVPQGYTQTNLHYSWQQLAPELSFADAVNVQSYVCEKGLAPKQAQTPEYAAVTNYGYHLDAGKFATLLQKHSTNNLNVTHILDNMVAVDTDDKNYITALETATHGRIAGDLFIDCSGSSALLIEKHYQSKLISQDHILFNNSALATQVPYSDETQDIASTTNSTAQSSGWIWDIGLSSRRGVGYTYSDKHISDQKAELELKQYLEQSIGAERTAALSFRKLSFTPGYRDKFWVKNCVAVGMSSGFIEPLEASALALIELSISSISEQMPQNRVHMTILANNYNERFTYRWQRVIEFLKLHYVLSKREDSQYWQDNHLESSIPTRLSTLLKLWQYQPPSRYDLIQNEEIFPSASYQYVLYGMDYNTQSPPHESQLENTQAGNYFFQANRRKVDQLLNGLPKNRELINALIKS